MKKLLSVLLALCMAVGIGLCGTVTASADEYGDVRGEMLAMFEGFKADMRLLPYFYALTAPGLRAELEAGLLPGKDKDAVFAALDSLVAIVEALSEDTSQELKDQTLVSFETLFSENFTNAFLSTFNTFNNAFVQAFSPIKTYIAEFDAISLARLWNPAAFYRVMDFLLWITGKLEPLLETGTFAQFTAFCTEAQTRLDSLLNPPRWWEKLPDILQWILRWILFGWIWMK